MMDKHESCYYIFLLLQQLVAIVLGQTNLCVRTYLTALTYAPTQHLFNLISASINNMETNFHDLPNRSLFNNLLGDFELPCFSN